MPRARENSFLSLDPLSQILQGYQRWDLQLNENNFGFRCCWCFTRYVVAIVVSVLLCWRFRWLFRNEVCNQSSGSDEGWREVFLGDFSVAFSILGIGNPLIHLKPHDISGFCYCFSLSLSRCWFVFALVWIDSAALEVINLTTSQWRARGGRKISRRDNKQLNSRCLAVIDKQMASERSNAMNRI